MIPTSIFLIWFRGLFSLGLVAGLIYCAHEWQQSSWRWDPVLQRSFFDPTFGWNEETALLSGAVALIVLACLGRLFLGLLFRLMGRASGSSAQMPDSPGPAEVRFITRPDGSKLKVEFHGPPDATPLVFTHGWGLDSREWNYIKLELSTHFRLVVWDEPGLGSSTRPANRDYSIENLAGHLDAVLSLVGKPALLVGHSIGGMIIWHFAVLSG